MAEVLVNVEVHCNQVSDVIVAHIGPLVFVFVFFSSARNRLSSAICLKFNLFSFYLFFFFVTRLETNVRE